MWSGRFSEFEGSVIFLRKRLLRAIAIEKCVERCDLDGRELGAASGADVELVVVQHRIWGRGYVRLCYMRFEILGSMKSTATFAGEMGETAVRVDGMVVGILYSRC